MTVCRGMTAEEIEAQYFLRALRPDYETTMLPRWLERSSRFIAATPHTLDLEYGDTPRSRLDYFPGNEGDAPFVLYIHGGYWQRGDKSVYSFVAEPLVARGISVALVNYDMCPNVRMSAIPLQVQGAVAWLWRNAADLKISRELFHVMGHSAGGHLSMEMMCTDWTQVGNDLPASLIKAGVALSGIYDFEPILYCSENEGLRMDTDEARSLSTMLRRPATDAPVLVAYGANEPPDMHRQSTECFERFQSACSRMECYEIPGADHFDVCDVIADPNSELFQRAMSFITT